MTLNCFLFVWLCVLYSDGDLSGAAGFDCSDRKLVDRRSDAQYCENSGKLVVSEINALNVNVNVFF